MQRDYTFIMKFFFFALFFATKVMALECHKPIVSHLSVAIEHNKKVGQLYSDLTDGRSVELSYTLINLERIARLVARPLDEEASIYQQRGIPVLCEEIPSMNSLPEFRNQSSLEERPEKYHKFAVRTFSENLNELMEKKQLNAAMNLTLLALRDLESAKNQQCLTKHFLESIAFTLKLTEQRRNEAREAGMADPLPLIQKYISLQRKTLYLTTYLDERAFPLQKEGLLIFCQDVPSVDWSAI